MNRVSKDGEASTRMNTLVSHVLMLVLQDRPEEGRARVPPDHCRQHRGERLPAAGVQAADEQERRRRREGHALLQRRLEATRGRALRHRQHVRRPRREELLNGRHSEEEGGRRAGN